MSSLTQNTMINGMLSGTKKIPVGILGATGMVGQKFIELLIDHPWFEITAVAASERSQGKRYQDAVQWRMETPLPSEIGKMKVSSCEPPLPCKIVFSGLDALVAGEIERKFAESSYSVVSNSRNHRMHQDVPLVVPEINSSHLALVQTQKFKGGMLVTNPNCSVIGITTALKPLVDIWGVEKAHVVTLQALSGAGYPGVPSFDILDNVIPFISGEEGKIETEPLKILGSFHPDGIVPYPLSLSASCNRVGVMDGHMACLSFKLKKEAKEEEIIAAWNAFSGEPQALALPSAPQKPLRYLTEEAYPQPKLHRHFEKGMGVSIGRLRKCPLLDWKCVVLSHNTVRGAAGSAILNAELLVKKFF